MQAATYIENLQEKKTAVIKCYCTPGDKKLMELAFGRQELSRLVRRLLFEALAASKRKSRRR